MAAKVDLAVFYFDDRKPPSREALRGGPLAKELLPRILTSSELLTGAIAVYNQSGSEVNEGKKSAAARFIRDYDGPIDQKLADQLSQAQLKSGLQSMKTESAQIVSDFESKLDEDPSPTASTRPTSSH